MNYTNQYDQLIERARNRKLEGFTERHHVNPTCMGGDDSPENIVRLTPEEHYTAHLLLVKMYPNSAGLIQAAARQAASLTGRKRKMYGWLRRKQAEMMRNRVISPETRAKMSAAQKGKKRGPFSAEHKAKLAAASKGRKKSEEHKAALSAAKTGKKLGPQSEEHLRKRVEAIAAVKPDRSFTQSEEYRQKQSEIAKRKWAERKAGNGPG